MLILILCAYSYQCPHCGPPTVYDEMEDVEDDLDEAYNVMDNMKDAFAGK